MQELISLLHLLDKKKVGHVSVHEFARGLQSCRNSAQVASAATPIESPELPLFKSPELLPLQRRHTISTVVSLRSNQNLDQLYTVHFKYVNQIIIIINNLYGSLV